MYFDTKYSTNQYDADADVRLRTIIGKVRWFFLEIHFAD